MESNKNVKKVYIHFGAGKTGTTSIQEAMLKNCEYLEKCGIYYPKTLPANHSCLVNLFSEDSQRFYDNRICRRSEEENQIYQSRLRELLVGEMLKCEAQVFIISGEGLGRLKTYEIEKMKAFFQSIFPEAEISSVFFTRQHMAHQSSIMQEIAAGGQDIGVTFSPWKKPYIIPKNHRCFRINLSKIYDAFGSSNTIVRKFEDACDHHLGLVGYFLSLIGMSESEITGISFVKSNAGRSDRQVHFLVYLQTMCPMIINGERNPAREPSDWIPLQAIRGNRFVLDKEVLENEITGIAEDCRWLKEVFGIDYDVDKMKLYEQAEMLFSSEYQQDIMRIFPRLTPVLQAVFYNYCREAKVYFRQPESVACFDHLEHWISDNFPDSTCDLGQIIKNARLHTANTDWLKRHISPLQQTPEIYYYTGLFLRNMEEFSAAFKCFSLASDLDKGNERYSAAYNELKNCQNQVYGGVWRMKRRLCNRLRTSDNIFVKYLRCVAESSPRLKAFLLFLFK